MQLIKSLLKRIAFLYGALSLSMFLFGFITALRVGLG